jgi:hypothetical protein
MLSVMSLFGQFKRVAPLAILLAAAVFLIWHWRTRDQREINRNLSRLQSLVAKSQEEGPITGLARAQALMRLFTPDAEVNLGVPLPLISDREELAAIVQQARASADRIQAVIRDRKLTIASNRQSAIMELTAEGIVTVHGREDRDIREFRLRWTRQEGIWLIAKVELTESIKRPPGMEGPLL